MPSRSARSRMPLSPDGRLADNIVYFARTLRKAGMRVGPASVKDAIEAVLAAGIGSRDDFYWTLHAVLVTRHEDHAGLRRGVPAVLEVARTDREDAGDVFAGCHGQAGAAEAAGRRKPRQPGDVRGPPQGRAAARNPGDRSRRALHRVRQRGVARQGLRPDVGGGVRARRGARSRRCACPSTLSRPGASAPIRAAARSIRAP